MQMLNKFPHVKVPFVKKGIVINKVAPFATTKASSQHHIKKQTPRACNMDETP